MLACVCVAQITEYRWEHAGVTWKNVREGNECWGSLGNVVYVWGCGGKGDLGGK